MSEQRVLAALAEVGVTLGAGTHGVAVAVQADEAIAATVADVTEPEEATS